MNLNDVLVQIGNDILSKVKTKLTNYSTTEQVNTALSKKVDKDPNGRLITNAEGVKLAGIEAEANKYTHPATHSASIITETDTKKFVTPIEKATWNAKAETTPASSSKAGLMSAEDKKKLDGISSGANSYTLPVADTDKLGGIKESASGHIAIDSTGIVTVKADSHTHSPATISETENKKFVSQAEKNTWNAKASTAIATTETNGLMSAADKTKLDGVQAKLDEKVDIGLTSEDRSAATQISHNGSLVTVQAMKQLPEGMNFAGLVVEGQKAAIIYQNPSNNKNQHLSVSEKISLGENTAEGDVDQAPLLNGITISNENDIRTTDIGVYSDDTKISGAEFKLQANTNPENSTPISTKAELNANDIELTGKIKTTISTNNKDSFIDVYKDSRDNNVIELVTKNESIQGAKLLLTSDSSMDPSARSANPSSEALLEGEMVNLKARNGDRPTLLLESESQLLLEGRKIDFMSPNPLTHGDNTIIENTQEGKNLLGINTIETNITNLQNNKASKDEASQSTKGLMSAADKIKLDNIEAGANKYKLPVAGTSIGGVKSGTDITVDTSGNVSIKDNSHNHTVSNISDFPASMPASDVKAWAKAEKKPEYNFSELKGTVAGSKVNGAVALATTAGTANNVAWENTNHPSEFTPSAHTHGNADITSLDASKLTGTIDIARLPQGALERCVVVKDDKARFALTKNQIQTGDTVKVTDSGKMFFVKDDNQLSSEAGYEIYTATAATSVPWSGVTDKPDLIIEGDSRLTNARPASDVSAWAKASVKPKYTKSEVGLENVENKSSATIRSEIDSSNVTTALGFTPIANNHVATGTSLGLVKSGKDITINASGEVSVNDNSHAHLWANISDHPTAVSSFTNDAKYLVAADIANKVDKVNGKQLSTNDYTTAEKNKLADLKNYTLPKATTAALGGVIVGSNISLDTTTGKVSLTKTNITDALGYIPPATNTTYDDATQKIHGLMSTTDKIKLDGIEAGANKYSLPAAGTDLGGIKTGGNITMASGVGTVTLSDSEVNEIIAAIKF